MKPTLLPDTSVWVDFLRHRRSYLRDRLAASDAVGYTQPVLMELLAGARDDREWELLRRFVTGAVLIPFDSVADFEAAAWIYRHGQGIARRVGQLDCLILAVAQRSEATLVTSDSGQAALAQRLGMDVRLLAS